jgi:predicted DNA-binding protein with PD1-like motif
MFQHVTGISEAVIGRVVQFKIKIGSSIVKAVEEAAAAKDIRHGMIIGLTGALQSATFRNLKYVPEQYPVKPDNHLLSDCEGPMEITSLTGWIFREGDRQLVHLHASAAKEIDGQPFVVGGHLVDAVAGAKLVVHLLEIAGGTARLGFDAGQSESADLIF